MKTICKNCGAEGRGRVCESCRPDMRRKYYATWKAKNYVKPQKECAKENCKEMFVVKGTTKYCIKHR